MCIREIKSSLDITFKRKVKEFGTTWGCLIRGGDPQSEPGDSGQMTWRKQTEDSTCLSLREALITTDAVLEEARRVDSM